MCLPAAIAQTVHQNRLLRLTREGTQTAAHQIEEYEVGRQYATLVAIALDTMATLTDEIIDLNFPFDKTARQSVMCGWRKPSNKHRVAFAQNSVLSFSAAYGDTFNR